MFLRTLPLLVPSTFEGEQLVWQIQGGPHRDILGSTSEGLQFASALNFSFYVSTMHTACTFYFYQQGPTYIHTYTHTHIYIYIILTIYYDHSYVFRSVSFSKEPIVSAFGGRGWVLKLRQHISP